MSNNYEIAYERFYWGFNVRSRKGFSNSCCPCLFFLIICTISDDVLRNINKNGGTWMKVDRCFFFPLTCFSLVTFPRNLAQIFRSDRCTYIRNIFFIAFILMTYFVAEEGFLNKYLATVFQYNSWNLNMVAFFSAELF